MTSTAQDKTFIFRKFFGFDVFSICHQFSKIMHVDNLDLYIYDSHDIVRLGNNTTAWMNFYETWIETDEEIVPLFTRFISDPYTALEEIYLSGSKLLQEHLDKCIKFNKKEDVYESFTEGLIKRANL